MEKLTNTLKSFSKTQEWQEWRSSGLGASDAPIVMGLSRFKTAFELFLEKTGKKKASTKSEAMMHGIDNEAKARDAYTLETGHFMPPANVESEELPWLHASLDGYDPDEGRILEVKCPWDIADHLAAREGQVPDHYYPQVQHAMAVSGLPRCHYWSFWEGMGFLLEVDFDQRYWEEELLPTEKVFWSLVQSGEYPLPKGKEEREDAAYLEAEDAVYQALAMKTVAEERLRSAKAKLARLATAQVTKGKYLEATWRYNKGGFVPGFQRSESLSLSFRRIK